MLEKCVQAVQAAAKAAGREKLTPSQVKAVEDRISATMRRMARTEENWRSMTADERLTAAAERAMQDIQAEAARAADLKVKQVVLQADAANRVQGLKAAAGVNENTALRRDYELTHIVQRQLAKDAHGELMDLIKATGDKQGAGIGRRVLMAVFKVDNPKMTLDVVREIFANGDGSTGNKVAQAGAKAWLETIGGLRERFNAAGGDVGQLDYGYVPQPHDQAKVRKAGAEAWAEKVLPLLDRDRYLNEDGSRMSDESLREFLLEAHKTIATDGLNKSEPGEFKGTGKRANRGSESREIHFADGDAWAKYMAEFGRGSLYDAMMRHINGITRDIALVERYGPDANGTARLLQDLAVRADGTTPEKPVGAMKINPQTYWNMISGRVGAPVDESIAEAFSMVRNVMTAAKLGGAVISSFSDLGTLAINAGYNRLPYWQLIKDIGAQSSKPVREWMDTHGMVAEASMRSLERWSSENLGNNWSGHLSNAVMRWSLLEAWTDGLRQGFHLSMNAKMGELSRLPWDKLTEFDRTRLQRAGITGDDWGKLNGVPLEAYEGRQLLTPQGIKAAGHQGLAEKVFGFIAEEGETAVTNPDMAARAVATFGGQQAGTYAGEIARTVTQFKSFPISMFTRHWSRMMAGDMGADGAPAAANRLVYGSALMVSLLGLGALSYQAKQLLQGKDPISMDPTTGVGARFWARSLATGGGLGIAGDMILVDPQGGSGDATSTMVKNLAGPAVGTATELLAKDVVENAWQAAEGKDTHWQAELLQWARSNTPGASVWWVKPMLEHGFLNAVNENLSPGYLSKQQERAYKDWHQRYWWKPRDTLPSREPDLSAAGGG
jgi:hypothetical protein